MNIPIKTNKEIQKMRIAGMLAAEVLDMIKPYVIQGVSTAELDRLCHDYIVNKQHAISACLGYRGFPKSVCISVNDVVCHGIPSEDQILKNSDIVNIDVTVLKDDYHGDTSTMFIVGNTSTQAYHLCDITQKSLYYAVQLVKPGIRLQTLGYHIQKFVEKHGFSIVREYCGHGIGKNFHENPQVLHYKSYDNGIILQPGMIFTIEPMVNVGNCQIRIMKDGWTVKTQDHSLSAQYEHTILVTQNSYEILTLRQSETIPILVG
ncbi:Methionine aminopeptidase [Candidatus Erwinia haradaeae]|uniref:Methionine aminopeptidase n=1 Tax=Candidatus Erwinia haradaeae TaxID=1922217 RepID=A0A451CYR0_9GAMM|nr:type I methionyl aminopeptidase [Candidatus Erwinia haradaeae]VFP78564.1 Methionine aminopeptidase [Candidatus Erwinia haradaeae]